MLGKGLSSGGIIIMQGARRIYLTGFMGSGKSYSGRQLAEHLGYKFVDLDEKIEEMAGKSIPQIFATEGESTFRLSEQEALHSTLSLSHTIIATGGGTPCFFANHSWMNQHGLTVFLDIPVPVLAQRLHRGKNARPLLKGLSDHELISFIKSKLASRRSFYEMAHVIYHPSEQSINRSPTLPEQFVHIIGH